jgi:hypothetical protein
MMKIALAIVSFIAGCSLSVYTALTVVNGPYDSRMDWIAPAFNWVQSSGHADFFSFALAIVIDAAIYGSFVFAVLLLSKWLFRKATEVRRH